MWEGLFAITRVLTAIISGILGPILIWWVKENFSNEEAAPPEEDEEKTIDEEVKFAKNISEELENIRKEIEADRVWISQFHNGGKTLSFPRKKSMKRISVTHEVVAPGVSREQQNFNGILLSFFTEIIDNLIKEDYTSYEKDKKEIAPEVELLFRQRGTVKMHLFSMRNIDGSLIGIMGVDYTEDKVSLSEKEVQYLKVRANLLAGYVIHGKVEIK